MTENTPKKPRRKRRTKAQIEAEKAAKLAAEQEECQECQDGADALAAAEAALEKEVKNDEVVVEMLEESVATSDAPVKEEPAASAKKQESEPLPEYVPQTGMSKLRQKMMQRRLKDQYAQQSRNQ